MKLRAAFSIFFIGFSGCSLANQLSLGEINEDAVHAAPTDYLATTPSLTILNYLSLFDEQESTSKIQAQSQLTVTPTATLTVNNIRLTVYNSTDGSCTTSVGNFVIGTTTAGTVVLTSGQPYVTTDASNRAAQVADSGANNWTPATDTKYQLRNGATLVGSNSCIQGGGTCNGEANCGWPTARSWAP